LSKRIPPGASWRIKYDDAPTERGGMYGPSHELVSADYPAGHMGQGAKYERVRTRTILDEVVLGGPAGAWLHIEQMDSRTWWLGIGEDKCMIRIDRNGKPVMGEWYK